MPFKRIAKLAAAAAILFLAAACDQVQQGFDEGFNKSWPKSVKEGCLKTGSAQVGAAVAERYCTCIVDALAPLSVQEKLNLKPDSPAMTAAVTKCTPPQPT